MLTIAERIWKQSEKDNRGWIVAGAGLPPTAVRLDGVELKNVLAVHRAKGKVKLCLIPLTLDKHKKNVRFVTLHGKVEVSLC